MQREQWFYFEKKQKENECVCLFGRHDMYVKALYYKGKKRTEEDDGKTHGGGDQVVGAKDLLRRR